MFLAFPSQRAAALPTYQRGTLIKDVSAWDRPSSWKQGYPCFSGAGIPPASVKHTCVSVPCFVALRQALFLNWIIFLSRRLLWFMNIRVHTFFIYLFFGGQSPRKKKFLLSSHLLASYHRAMERHTPRQGHTERAQHCSPRLMLERATTAWCLWNLYISCSLTWPICHPQRNLATSEHAQRERQWGPNPQDLITWHPPGTPSMDTNHHDSSWGAPWRIHEPITHGSLSPFSMRPERSPTFLWNGVVTFGHASWVSRLCPACYLGWMPFQSWYHRESAHVYTCSLPFGRRKFVLSLLRETSLMGMYVCLSINQSQGQ